MLQGLREECIKLKMRVFDLEQQNRTLSVLFQQKVKPASDLLLQVGNGLCRKQPMSFIFLKIIKDFSYFRGYVCKWEMTVDRFNILENMCYLYSDPIETENVC